MTRAERRVAPRVLIGGVALCIAAFPGCVAYRPVAPPDGPGPDTIAQVLASAGDGVEISGPIRSLDITAGEAQAYLFIFSVGLIPQGDAYEDVWTVTTRDDDDEPISFDATTTRTAVCGWLAGPLALLPGWSFGGAGCHAPTESAEQRANREAHAARAIAAWLEEVSSEER